MHVIALAWSYRCIEWARGKTIQQGTLRDENGILPKAAGRGIEGKYQAKSAVDEEYTPSFTLTLQESQDVLLADRALHVTDDGTAGIVHELDTDLRDTTTGASASQDLLQ